MLWPDILSIDLNIAAHWTLNKRQWKESIYPKCKQAQVQYWKIICCCWIKKKNQNFFGPDWKYIQNITWKKYHFTSPCNDLMGPSHFADASGGRRHPGDWQQIKQNSLPWQQVIQNKNIYKCCKYNHDNQCWYTHSALSVMRAMCNRRYVQWLNWLIWALCFHRHNVCFHQHDVALPLAIEWSV